VALRPALWRRVPVFLCAFLVTGVMFLFYGTSRSALPLALSMFALFFTLPLAWGLFTSLLQLKTPPDMQGRVFSVFAQLGFIASTASFLSVGPLVDQLLEPAALRPDWAFAGLVGAQPGSGMGLVLLGAGVVILVLTVSLFLTPAVRRVEAALPDYEVENR